MARQNKFNNVRFDTPKIQSKTIRGVECTIKRLPATTSPEVLAHLLADFGEIAGNLLSKKKDEEIEVVTVTEDDEAEIVAETLFGNIRKMITTAGLAALASQIRSRECLDIRWYMEKLLVKNLSIHGVELDDLEDFDALGADLMVLWEIIEYALEVNFAPFFDDPDTDDGSGTKSEDQEQAEPERPKPPILMTSSPREEPAKDGQRAPM